MFPRPKLTEEQAEKIIARKRELLSVLGLPETEIIQKISPCQEDFALYRKAHQLREEGKSYRQISLETGIAPWTIRGWLGLGKIPFRLSAESAFSTREERLPKEDASPADIAKLLGFISASRGCRAVDHTEFSFSSQEKETLEEILVPLAKHFSVRPIVANVYYPDSWTIRFCSASLLEYFNQQTFRNTAVPWQLMASSEEKAEYFKGFFMRRGEPDYRLKKDKFYLLRITFSFQNNPALGQEFSVLLFDLGLIPAYNQGELVEIVEPEDIRKVVDFGWCPSHKRLFLEEKLKSIKLKKSFFSAEMISELIEATGHGEIPYPQALGIAKKSGILPETFYSWIVLGKMPRPVRRYRQLKAFSQMIGSREALYFLYQKLNFGLEEARAAAREISPQLWKDLSSGKWGSGHEIGDYDLFSQRADVLAWYLFDFGKRNHLYPAGEPSSQYSGLLRLEDLFNMFLPESHLNCEENIRSCHLQLYRQLKTHPSFSQLVILAPGEIYVPPGRLPLLEDCLKYGGFGRTKRNWAEARELTGRLKA